MKDKKPETLTIQKLHHIGAFIGMSPGNALIHRFCDAIDAGIIPAREDLEQLAYALSVFKDGNADARKHSEFCDRLKIKKKQGKQVSEQHNIGRYVDSVCLFLLRCKELEEQGLSTKEAENKAELETAEANNIGLKAMRNRIKTYRKAAEAAMGAQLFSYLLEARSCRLTSDPQKKRK